MVRRLALAISLLVAVPAFAKKPHPAPAPAPAAAPAPAPAAAPAPAPAAAPAAAPASADKQSTSDDQSDTGQPIQHPTIPPLHVPPEQMGQWISKDQKDLVGLQKKYEEFCSAKLGQNEDEDMKILTQDKPAELGALQDQAMAIIKKRQGSNPSAAAFVLANAMLADADLAYSMRPTQRMNPKQAEKFWGILENEVWPSFKGVDADAKAYLTSIEKGASAKSPWKKRAADLISKMEAAGRGERPPPPAPAPAPGTPAPAPAPGTPAPAPAPGH